MLQWILIAMLFAGVIALTVVVMRLRKEISRINLKLWTASRQLDKTMKKAEDILNAHAETEKEAEKAEQLFQEGLQNILNYGVIKNG